jgi:cytosine/adenosine deaminase-related metal-dependent hydrolase
VLPPGQEYAWYAGAVGEEAHWLGLATRRPVRYVGFEDAGRLEVGRPGDRVLLALAACIDGEPQITYSMAPPPDLSECVAQPGASAGR